VDVQGAVCMIVAEKSDSRWNAFGTYCGQPIVMKGAKTRKGAIDGWQHRAMRLAKSVRSQETLTTPGILGIPIIP
jgi:hypothetical protein